MSQPITPGDVMHMDGLLEVQSYDEQTGLWHARATMGKLEVIDDLGDWLSRNAVPEATPTRCPNCGHHL